MIPSYLDFSHIQKKSIHFAICGSISFFKILELIRILIKKEVQVSCSLTKAAQEFVTPLTLKALGCEPVHTNMFSENEVYSHLYPGYDPDLFVVAPATANIIAKIANGIADDLVSTQALSFNGTKIVIPAMNPRMYLAQQTQKNIEKLKRMGIYVMTPSTGDVACGEEGPGRLPEIVDIYFYILKVLCPKDLKGEKVLITMGPTREFFDPVRFWSNPSSGKMGAALAVSAWLRGAEVTCVTGPTNVWLPSDIIAKNITSAKEMFKECNAIWDQSTIGVLSAAVCDFRPKNTLSQKFKKDSVKDLLVVEFEKNPDILANLGKNKKPNQRLIGFAAETDSNFINLAKEKIKRKNLDWIVANKINEPHVGFGSDTNEVVIISSQGHCINISKMTKADVAWKIWDLVVKA